MRLLLIAALALAIGCSEPWITVVVVTPTPAPRVYESCAHAEVAGEMRVQGGRGTGWGYPAAMVPSIQDADNDGVVCEENNP